MPIIQYSNYRPNARSLYLIQQSVSILEEYAAMGYTLTLRQLYYQLVSRDEIPNSQKSYNNLGNIISKARDGGYIDWGHIVDRTRRVRSQPSWSDAEDFLSSAIPQYHHDLWLGQDRRVFVFVEKEALEQVVSRPAERWDCPYFANKGYLSSSAAWNVAHNMMLKHEDCQDFVILHLGDHDPSGIDMTRDIQDRINCYSRRVKPSQRPVRVEVQRIALNMDQINEYEPPPNPAKQTDSRFTDYEIQYGDQSWELDALRPTVIDELIDDAIQDIVDVDMWQRRKDAKDRIIADMKSKFGLN